MRLMRRLQNGMHSLRYQNYYVKCKLFTLIVNLLLTAIFQGINLL